MITVLYTDHTNAIDFGHGDGLFHAMSGSYEAKGVFAVDLSDNGGGFCDGGLSGGGCGRGRRVYG
jgi:hypothetical protein